MDLGLRGRKAIVCASSRGLGRGCALALAEAGVELVVNGRDERTVAATAAEIAQRYRVKVTPVPGDVGTKAGQDALFAACPEPDILVTNNAGPPFRDFRELDRQAMVDGVLQNMISPIEIIQRAIDGMAKNMFGRVVNITSKSVLEPTPGLDLSSGARAGLTAFIAGVARQVADKGITINNILPGAMDTDRLRSLMNGRAQRTGKTLDDIRAERIAKIPAKRLGTAEEFGAACAFLCSVHAGYITGQNLLIDGGDLAKSF